MSEEQTQNKEVDAAKIDVDSYTSRAMNMIQRTVIETLISVEYMAKLASMLLQSRTFVSFIRPIITDVVQQILAEERRKQEEVKSDHVKSE